MKTPNWLPQVVSVNGPPDEVFSRLYKIFHVDFVSGRPRFQGLSVFWDRRKINGSAYEEGFWHLITKDNKEYGGRLLDPRRAERLPWCAPIITHDSDPEIRIWDYRERRKRLRTYVWLVNWDYVIVLERRSFREGIVAYLITAFYVSGDSTKKNLEKKYNKRES